MRFGKSTGRSEMLPSLAIVLGGVLWGLFWLPVRAIGDLGLGGAWPGVAIYGGCMVVLLPVLLFRWQNFVKHWRPLAVCGLFTGTALACYSTSLLLTEVVRSILLFYLTPVWSTLLGMLLLGERLTVGRALALVLGAVGLLVVLGIGSEVPWPRNPGDWLALVSGMAWAYGSLSLYRMGSDVVPEQMLTFSVGSLAVTFTGIALGGAVFGGVPSAPVLYEAAPFGLLAALFVLPMLFLTIWPATLLSPGRIGILLMSEVVVGVASAAALAGEPFGLREMLGTGLIVAAGAVEVFGRVRI
jgi:drug/metabolite transporter (DMT)-like permease